MTEQRSPELERLFATADRELTDEAFVARVMASTHERPRQRVALAVAACVVAAPLAWLVAQPLSETFLWLMQIMARPVAPLGDGIASTALPINSVGGALALSLLGLRAAARRLFAENN